MFVGRSVSSPRKCIGVSIRKVTGQVQNVVVAHRYDRGLMIFGGQYDGPADFFCARRGLRAMYVGRDEVCDEKCGGVTKRFGWLTDLSGMRKLVAHRKIGRIGRRLELPEVKETFLAINK